MLVVLQKEKDGLIHISREELERLLKQSYDEGFNIGKKDNTIINPNQYYPLTTWDTTKVGCVDKNNVKSTLTYGGK